MLPKSKDFAVIDATKQFGIMTPFATVVPDCQTGFARASPSFFFKATP